MPAAKPSTLSDIAREAGVSRSAAARVLLGTGGDHVRVSEATRERIEAAAVRLRYTPNRHAQQLRGMSSKTIGVILDTINIPVMSQRLFAVESEASQRGYRLLVGQVHGREEILQEYALDLASRGAEAILCLFDLAPSRDERAKKAFGNFRKVVFHGRPAWTGGYAVRVDTETALRSAVDHLVSRGKKSLALSLSNCELDELMALRKRVFQQRLGELGMEGVVWEAAVPGSQPSAEKLDQGIDYMVRKCGADAILASNDVWATRFILQLQKSGLRVPEDVAVVGYDNLDISSVVSPALTTIDQNHEEYAKAAFELLLRVSEDSKIAQSERVKTISPALLVREST